MLGLHRDTGAILIVDDSDPVAADQDTVRGAEASRCILGIVHPNFQRHKRGAGVGQGFSFNRLQVGLCSVFHVGGIRWIPTEFLQSGVVGTLANGLQKVTTQLVLADGVGQTAGLRILAGGLREQLLHVQILRASAPADNTRRTQVGMYFRRWHQICAPNPRIAWTKAAVCSCGN